MPDRIRIAVVAGGFSEERVISMKSSETIMNGLDPELFDPILVKIVNENWVCIVNGDEFEIDKNNFTASVHGEKLNFDFAFIIIHGTPGEDGILQAYFELIGIPYSTGDSANMGLTFDKAYTQMALRGKGFRVAKNMVLQKGDHLDEEQVRQDLGVPCFVKPSRAGSSLGISKVKDLSELQGALNKAFEEHSTAIIESFLDGVEITCGVYRKRGELIALPVTEIVSANEFFDYDAKYLDDKTQEITPARIEESIFINCQELSKKIYHQLGCQGIVRIDYMLVHNELFVIELNTVPGMSVESIIPKQLKAADKEMRSFLSDLISEKMGTKVLY
ncbi:MAG: D-alanine--D-alanine ligase [Flavobacteriales bacterium]|nr:D-alanine--D-alanine ligase [Flavobacteriales bacterium]